MKRFEFNCETGETQEIDLTPEEVAQAEAQYAAWQIEETARLAAVAAEQERQAKFEEWLQKEQP